MRIHSIKLINHQINLLSPSPCSSTQLPAIIINHYLLFLFLSFFVWTFDLNSWECTVVKQKLGESCYLSLNNLWPQFSGVPVNTNYNIFHTWSSSLYCDINNGYSNSAFHRAGKFNFSSPLSSSSPSILWTHILSLDFYDKLQY